MKVRENELYMFSGLFLHLLNKCVYSSGLKGHVLTGNTIIHLDSGQKSFLPFLVLLAQILVLNFGNKCNLVLWYVIYSIALGKKHKILMKWNKMYFHGVAEVESLVLLFLNNIKEIWSLFFLSLKGECSFWLTFKVRVMDHT